MNILVISHMYPNTYNSISGIFVHKQVKELINLGHNVRVVSPIPWTPFPLNRLKKKWSSYDNIPKKSIIDNVEVFYPRYLEYPRGIRMHKSGMNMYKGVFNLIEALHENIAFDIIHAHVALPDGYCGMKISKKLKLPLIVTVHGQDFQHTINKNGMCKKNIDEVMNYCEEIITVSNKLKNGVKREAYFNKIKVIHNGIDIEDFKSIDNTKRIVNCDNIMLVSVSNLYKEKGIDLNIKAVNELIKGNNKVHYFIVGDGPERETLEDLVESLELKEFVTFVGRLPHKDAMQYISKCDIYSLPSYNEGFGISYIEAMYLEKPIIAVKGQGIEDIIRNKYNGILVQGKNIDSLVEALNYLIINHDKSNEIGENAKKDIINNLTWGNNVKLLIQEYENCINRRILD